jgi:hypothetical protein
MTDPNKQTNIEVTHMLPGTVRWAHAVNSKSLLENALHNPEVDFLEVDLSVGEQEIIAAHPPQTHSDLSMKELVQTVNNSDKGLKLDFKDPRTVKPTLNVLKNEGFTPPVILNADILATNGAPEPDIDGQWFINSCLAYSPSAWLSLGWRTTGQPNSFYSEDDVTKMLQFCRSLENVTFPVRTSMLPQSRQNVERLMQQPNYTLTLWNPEPLSLELSIWVKENTNPERCFYDVIFTD